MMFNVVIAFLAVFFSLFGPKYGNVDTSILGTGLIFVFLLSARNVRIQKELFVLLTFVFVVFVYTLFVYFTSNYRDDYIILRSGRAVVITIILGVIFYNINIKLNAFIDIIILALAINSTIMFLQVLVPETQLYFAPMYGFEAGTRPFRAFGLTSGYDAAGYLCILGITLTALLITNGYMKFRYVVSSILFLLSAILSSRTAMFLSTVIYAYICASYLLKEKWRWKVFSIINLSLAGYILHAYILPVFFGSIPFLRDYDNFNTFGNGMDISQSFAFGTFENWKDMWILPRGDWNLLIGEGINPLFSDIGYVKILFMTGVIGLLLTILTYIYLAMRLHFVKAFLKDNFRFQREYKLTRMVINVLLLFMLGMLVVNSKNLYLLSRTYYDIILTIYFSVFACIRRFGISRASSPGIETPAID